MKRRMWYIQMVDVEVDSDGSMNPTDEPKVLAATYLPAVAEKALGCIRDAERKDAINNMVRSTVDPLPVVLQEVLEKEAERAASDTPMLDEILENL